jgi:tRNA (guanine37-N1)-methyltransferase
VSAAAVSNGSTPSALRIDVFTIVPEYVEGALGASILGRGRAAGLLDVRVHDPRAQATDRHRSVDDAPFGGGPGMVMMPGPLFAAVEAADPPRPLLLLSPSGRRFDQARAHELAAMPGFSLLCGRYEGVDQRVADHLCDGELSVGDFVLAGGEAAALVVIEAVARLVPGVLGNEESTGDESFSAEPSGTTLLEYPQYTRPAEFRGWEVPEVLRSGDHGRVARWRRAEALRRTAARRPDLVRDPLAAADEAVLREFPHGEAGR